MRDDQVKLLTDNRVSDAGRVLGLYISNLVPGEWHELRYEVLATLLQGFPSNDTIARHLRQLELAGYVERKKGGRGRSPSFLWIAPQESGPKSIEPQETGPKTPDSPAQVPTDPIEPQESGPIPEKTDATHVREQTVFEVEDEDGDEVPPSMGFPHDLHEKADAAIERYDEQLTGCRGALRDYLQSRVPPARQYPYVQTIACWFDGSQDIWRQSDGSRLPKEERPPMLALALNDLAASDELTMKRPVGDPANLRTKLNVLLQQRDRHERRNGSSGDHSRGAGQKGRGKAGKSAAGEGSAHRKGFVIEE